MWSPETGDSGWILQWKIFDNFYQAVLLTGTAFFYIIYIKLVEANLCDMGGDIFLSQETWEILCGMKTDDVELQLALQCAPLITGLKISNLLTISPDGFDKVEKIINGSFISMYPLLETEKKIVILLYQKERLEKYLRMTQVQNLLAEAGYTSCLLEEILPAFCEKYETYAETKQHFPHELGLLLGYPPEDVEGFIRHQGRNCLCTGYWKVYADKEGKLRLFEKYEYAKENLIQLLHYGLKMAEIIEICGNPAA